MLLAAAASDSTPVWATILGLVAVVVVLLGGLSLIISRQVGEVTNRIDDLKDTLSERTDTVETHGKERAEALERHLGERLDTVTGSITQLNASVGKTTDAQNAAVRELADLGARLRDTLSSELRDVRQDLRSIGDRVARLEQAPGGGEPPFRR